MPANDYERIEKALTFIKANFKKQPDLEQVAEHLNLSPFHFHKMFVEWAGVSPKKFLQYLSLENLKQLIKCNNVSLAEAAFETGLSGTGRLHDLFITIEGMTPGTYKNLGKDLEIKYNFQESIFGKILIASTKTGICNLSFIQDEVLSIQELKLNWPKADIIHDREVHQDIMQRIFRTNTADPLKLNLRGTPFQLKVWEALLKIPEGALSNYSEIAAMIGAPAASRAVGTAIGQNPVAYLIPCHRVIKRVGGIGEYRWGSVRKMALIGWEASRINFKRTEDATLSYPDKDQMVKK